MKNSNGLRQAAETKALAGTTHHLVYPKHTDTHTPCLFNTGRSEAKRYRRRPTELDKDLFNEENIKTHNERKVGGWQADITPSCQLQNGTFAPTRQSLGLLKAARTDSPSIPRQEPFGAYLGTDMGPNTRLRRECLTDQTAPP